MAFGGVETGNMNAYELQIARWDTCLIKKWYTNLQIVAGIISNNGFWPIDTAIANEILLVSLPYLESGHRTWQNGQHDSSSSDVGSEFCREQHEHTDECHEQEQRHSAQHVQVFADQTRQAWFGKAEG